MNLFGLLEKFLNRNDSKNGGIVISEDFCVRLKSPMASCYECINRCPEQAVKISDSQIEILDACTNCEACIYICPNSVFDSKDKKNKETKRGSAQARFNDIETKKSKNINYFCSEIAEITENDLIDDCLKISCITEIEDLEIVKLFKDGKKIVLIKEDCKFCKLNYFHNKKIKRINEIASFLDSKNSIKEVLWSDFDIKRFTKEQTSLDNIDKIENDNGAYGNQTGQSKQSDEKNKEIARRDFFKNSLKGIKNKAKELAGELSIEDLPFSELYSQYLDSGDKQDKKINRRLIERQKEIYKFLKGYPQLLPIFNIRLPKINKNCVFCGNCWELCPTQALKFKNKGIFLEPFLCTGCNLCKDLCSFGAVRMHKAGTLTDISKEKVLLLQTEFNEYEENN